MTGALDHGITPNETHETDEVSRSTTLRAEHGTRQGSGGPGHRSDSRGFDPSSAAGLCSARRWSTILGLMIKRVVADGSVLVTFELSSDVASESVFVCGDFNGWTHSHPLDFQGDAFRATVRLRPGRSYRFRYFFDGGHWENDWAADAYVPNMFGGEDSVVDLTAVTGAAPPPAAESHLSGHDECPCACQPPVLEDADREGSHTDPGVDG